MNRRKSRALASSLVAALMSLALTAFGSGTTDDPRSRQDVAAERGAGVMPFDLDVTIHQFGKDPDGVTQTVVAHDPGDSAQIRLIRGHLRSEVTSFSGGDFGDPASIHGQDMPGLRALENGAENIGIRYSGLPDGGRIQFETDDEELVKALHAWADAQVSDHGEDAEHE